MDRRRFLNQYGVTPEAYLQSQGYALDGSGKVTKQEQPKDFYSDPAVREAVEPHIVAQSGDTSRKEVSPGVYDADTLSVGERALRNAAAGVPAIAAGVPAIAGLATTLPGAAYNYATADDPDVSFWDTFADQVFTPEAQKTIQDQVDEAAKEFIKTNPSATKEDVEKFAHEYVKTNEHIDLVRSLMPGTFAATGAIQDFSNRLAGLDTRMENMTAGDDAAQIVGGAFVGIGPKLASKLSQKIASAVGERVATNPAAIAAARVAEFATPVTMPLTPANIALNAAAGTAINEAVRYSQDDDTLIDYEQLAETAFDNPNATVVGAATAGLAAVSPVAASRAAAKSAAKTAIDSLDAYSAQLGQGRSLKTQAGSEFESVTGPLDGAIDDIAELQKTAREFGATQEQMDDIEIAALSGTYTRRAEILSNITNYGELDLSHKTIPLVDIQRAWQSVPQGTENLNTYLQAVSRQQDTRLQAQRLAKQIQDEVNLSASYKLSGNTQAERASQAKLSGLRDQYRAVLADDPSSRPNIPQLSRTQVDDVISKGDSIPEFVKVRQAFEKYSHDMLDLLRREGDISQELFDELRTSRPLYFPLRERVIPDKTGLTRRAMLFGKKLVQNVKTNDYDGPVDGTNIRKQRDLDVREGGKVELPKDAFSALAEWTEEVVTRVAANRGRRQIVDTFRNLPDAEGKVIRAHEFHIGRSKTKYVSPEAYAKAVADGRIDPSKYFVVNDGGKVSAWQFASEGLNELMKFKPSATVPIMNASRKTFQIGTTGYLNPAFAPLQMARDIGLGMVTRPERRAFGVIDATLQKHLDGTALGSLAKNIIDPTSVLAVPTQIPIQLWRRAQRALSQKIYSDLAAGDGIAAVMQASPLGGAWVKNIADAAAKAFDQSAYGLMSKELSSSFSHMNEIGRVLDDFTVSGRQSTGVAKAALDGWKSIVESMQMATRVSFWSQNIGILSHKYGGFDKIPHRELDLLALDTRNFTGDMSRRSKSRFVQGMTSTMPYSNTILQGTRHFLSAANPNGLHPKNNFWPLFIQAVMVPKLTSMAVLASWPEAEDWWYNKTPAWKRAVTMPIPQPRAILTRVQTGKWPEGDPSTYMMQLPATPEFQMILQPFEQMVRASGVLGESGVPIPGWGEASSQLVHDLIGLPMPPVVNAMFANAGLRVEDAASFMMGKAPSERPDTPLGGANSDQATPHNSMSAWMYDIIGSFIGTAGRNTADALNVGELSLKDGDGIVTALDKAFSFYIESQKQALPSVNPLYDIQERKYASTPEAEYVYQTQQDLKPVFDQLTRERDTSGRAAANEASGIARMSPTLKDPVLKAMSQLTYNTINKKGEYKAAGELYTSLRSTLTNLERVKVSPSEYHRRRNQLVRAQQEARSRQATILRELEGTIREAAGPAFEQRYGTQFSFKALSELVRKDVSR